ncbi:hypothetical protein AB205_0074770, partial [Aquarana catesbeiana]
MEVTAHFRTLCRKAGPASVSEKSIADVASVFQLKAFCLTCKQGLSDKARIEKHITKTSHDVKWIISIEESILAFCYLNEGMRTPSDFCLLASNARLEHLMLKRNLNNTDDSNVLSKHVQQNETDGGLKKEANIMVTAWFCECSQQFSAEKDAEKHIMAANRISHKCMVCGKLADDTAIIRLHMCRFHGGGRLDSFLFWCQMCKVELARTENVLMHIIDCHGGHSFYYEQEVPEEQPTSLEIDMRSESPASNTSPSGQQSEGLWQCHICEETFDNEETVLQHCQSLSIHQFHKYCCDTCKKKFLKMETLLRHCQLQHDGDIKVKYFCGLCKDLYFDEEAAFLAHYESFHALDYSYIPNRGQSNVKIPDDILTTSSESEKRLTCGCLEKYFLKATKKADGKLCLDRLFGKGNLWYSCSLCPATDQNFEGINTHVCKKEGQSSDRNVVIKCSICSKSFSDPEGAQSHYHMKHCFLKEPSKNYNFKTDESIGEVFTFTASGTSVSKPPARLKHTKELHYKAETKDKNLPEKIQPETEVMEIQNRDTELQDCELPDLDFLRTMTHIVFIDLDNWAQFFSHLPGYLNQGTFVWGFQGGKGAWKPPMDCKFFKHLSNTGCFFLHPRCSDRKDAADFAICIHAGRLDERLPKQIPFSVLSGDKGFIELENQFKKTQRSAHILNPHHVGGDVMCALLNSISETTQ